MQVWNVLHVARWKYRTQKWRKKSPSRHHPTTLLGYIFAIKACIDNRKKNLLSTNMSFTCPHNMVNFDALTAEIGSTIWGTPANFNWFLDGIYYSSGRRLNFAALNRGRQLCSAGRPSRWALAHILVLICITHNVKVSFIVLRTDPVKKNSRKPGTEGYTASGGALKN